MKRDQERLTITFRRLPDGDPEIEFGRRAWALRALVRAGERGCTPLDTPGPRWSAYVHRLRERGIVIETIHESHDGPFPGSHARYVLRSDLEILSDSSVAPKTEIAA